MLPNQLQTNQFRVNTPTTHDKIYKHPTQDFYNIQTLDMKQQQDINESQDQQSFRIQPEPNAEDQQALRSLIPSRSSKDPFSVLLQAAFEQMEGTPAEKVKRLMNRLQKFFLRDSRNKINVKKEFFCPRREPLTSSMNTQYLNNQIVLFGIDFMKTRDIIKSYLPDQVKPMDMSHIKLVYDSFDSAMEALRRNQREGVMENLPKLQSNEVPRGWMQMRPYYISNYERRLVARFATVEQAQVKKKQSVQSNIPLYAQKIYNLKKKQSEDIEENFRLRQQKLRLQREERRGKYSHCDENKEQYNSKRSEKSVQQKSQNTFKIGRNNGNNSEKDDKSISYRVQRQRSREKDFDDDKKSVASQKSKSSVASLVGRFQNNMALNQKSQKGDSESVVSDVSFILDQGQNQEVFQDMAIRLGFINLNSQQQNNDHSMSIIPESAEHSFASQSSSYSLTHNMPGSVYQDPFKKKTEKKPWKYGENQQEWDRQQEIKRKEKNDELIVIDSD